LTYTDIQSTDSGNGVVNGDNSTATTEQTSNSLYDSFTSLTAEDLANMSPEEIAAITLEEFLQIPVDSFSGLTSNNIAAFQPHIYDIGFTFGHIVALNTNAFTQSTSVSKIFTNLSLNVISPSGIVNLGLLPPNWDIDMETGVLIPPVGTKIIPRDLFSQDIPPDVVMPKIGDFDTDLALGGGDGQGTSLIEEGNLTLTQVDLSQFVLSQNDVSGILKVEGTGVHTGIEFTLS